MKNSEQFFGPLFIVGMPRSGTKLLRDLLNNHPDIAIPDIETNLIPTWEKNWKRYGDLSNRKNFHKFYRKMLSLSYFNYMNEKGCLIVADAWYKYCKDFTIAGVFEALIRHDAKAGYDSMKIWGDKSPLYFRHIPLLKDIFPKARFIHIIRDVRDYCLSINMAWRKNMFRAAQRWCNDVQKFKICSKGIQSDYIEVRYEDLIAEPDMVLKKICDFLNIEYYPQMMHLSAPTENLGDAKGLREIKKDNKEKYSYSMKPDIQKKIEAIAMPVLKMYGYPLKYAAENIRINSIELFYYKLFDGINLFRFSVKEKGFLNAFSANLKFYKIKK